MPRHRKVQLLLWMYFWLLLFEGVLRKWILPGLSNPLLVIRDPVCILAIYYGWNDLIYSAVRSWVVSIWVIGILAFAAGVLVGHGDVVTAFFGARILFLHFPLIFLFAAVFNREDLWRFGKWTLILAIPMACLIAAQFSLPFDHILNIGPGGEDSFKIWGGLDKLRPSGAFSFISGVAGFFSLALVFLMGWLICGPRPLPIWIWLSAGAILFALPLSISRTMFFLYVSALISAAVASFLAGFAFRRFLAGLAVVGTLALGISTFGLFQEAKEAFLSRWEGANMYEAEGSVYGVLTKRVGGPIFESLAMFHNVEILGKGIGLGTNVGAVRATGDKGFIVSEGAWPVIIGEMGPFLGFLWIFWRLALAFYLGVIAFKQAMLGNALPMIFVGVALQGLVVGQNSQPTALGFIVVCVGFLMAACNPPQELLTPHEVEPPFSTPPLDYA